MAKKKAAVAEAGEVKPEPQKTAPSKMGMVREALDELGADAKPAEIGEYVKAKHGAEIPPQVISSYKSVINSKPKGGYGMSRGTGSRDVSVGDVAAVKELIERVEVKDLTLIVRVLRGNCPPQAGTFRLIAASFPSNAN
jgi:hypothetical protein